MVTFYPYYILNIYTFLCTFICNTKTTACIYVPIQYTQTSVNNNNYYHIDKLLCYRRTLLNETREPTRLEGMRSMCKNLWSNKYSK